MKTSNASSAWHVEFEDRAAKLLSKIPAEPRERILTFLRERVQTHPDPVQIAEPLHGKEFAGLYRFRVGDFRIICRFERRVLIVVVVNLGHRSRIYLR